MNTQSDNSIYNASKEVRAVQEIPNFLRALVAVQKQISLYGSDHPNSRIIVQSLIDPLNIIIEQLHKFTIIFTKTGCIVNDSQYDFNEAPDLFKRMRARGVMAVTIVSVPPQAQILEFIYFINTEPAKIRSAGGPRRYLRSSGVTRIVVTEAVYTSGEDIENNDAPISVDITENNLDHSIAVAIEWLNREHADSTVPSLPITEILSDPVMTARLIREAVTKLHTANTDSRTNNLAAQAIIDVSNLTDDPEKWDTALPQIRKSISKLPPELRPVSCGQIDNTEDKRVVDVCDIEFLIKNAVENHSNSDLAKPDLSLDELNNLFNVQTNGILSSWKAELQQGNIIKSSGSTLGALLAWETKPSEHNQITLAIASLINKAIDASDNDNALLLIEKLTNEIQSEDFTNWRSINARGSIRQIDINHLKSIVLDALESGSYHKKDISAALVANYPELAVSMADTVGIYRGEAFEQSLRTGLKRAGTAGASALSMIMKNKIPLIADAAFEILLEIGNSSAVNEIINYLHNADPEFTVSAITNAAKMKSQFASSLCIDALSSNSSIVRCTAIRTLADIKYKAALSQIKQIINEQDIFGKYLPEKLEAIKALSTLGSKNEINELKALSRSKSFFFKNRSQAICNAALEALAALE